MNSKFLIIKCPRCGKRRVIFGKSTTKVKCVGCNKLLIKPTGGKTRIKAPVEEII